MLCEEPKAFIASKSQEKGHWVLTTGIASCLLECSLNPRSGAPKIVDSKIPFVCLIRYH